MKVSIVTAAFRAEYMDRAWASVLSQTHKEWEWVIINDGQESVKQWYHEKKSFGMFDGYDVWFIDLEKNLGRFGLYSRNIGAMVAKNNDVCFLDDDNELEPDHIESLLKLKEETGKIPYCDIHVKGKKPGSTFDRIKPSVLHRGHIDLGCLLYSKELFNKVGYFKDTRPITFDWDYINSIIKSIGEENFVPTHKASLIFWHRRY